MDSDGKFYLTTAAYIILPAVTYQVMSWANAKLKVLFSPDAEFLNERRDLLKKCDGSSIKIYCFLETLVFLILAVVLGYAYAMLPVRHLRGLTPEVIDFEPTWSFFVFCLSILVCIPHAAYVSNAFARLIFKIFNPEENSRILVYCSKIMNPKASGQKMEYNFIDGHKILAAVMTIFFSFCLFMAINNYWLICKDGLIFKPGPFQAEVVFPYDQLEIVLEAKSDRKRDGKIIGKNYSFKILHDNRLLLNIVRSDRKGSTDYQVLELLMSRCR